MADPVSIVVQGPWTQWTCGYLERYLGHSGDVIYSGWDRETITPPAGVRVVQSPPLANPGPGNRNLQIVSSRAGVALAKHEWAVKVRSDLFLPEFERMARWAESRHRDHDLFVLGMFTKLPLHPRDHVFWGKTADLRDLFDIPLDPNTRGFNEGTDLRTETYLGMWYYARHYPQAGDMALDPDRYLLDEAPWKEMASALHRLTKGRLFVPFPRVAIEWPKHYPDGHYPWAKTKDLYGEYTADDPEALS